MGETGNTVVPVQPGCSRALNKVRAVRPEEDRMGERLDRLQCKGTNSLCSCFEPV